MATPEKPEAPEVPIPEKPDVPFPEKPDVPEIPAPPEIPLLPEIPEIPSIPLKPDVPGAPLKPEDALDMIPISLGLVVSNVMPASGFSVLNWRSTPSFVLNTPAPVP